MTIFLSGSFSSAISLAARALFMLPDSCEEIVIAIAQSACSNCASHASGVGQEVWPAERSCSMAESISIVSRCSSSTKSRSPMRMVNGTLVSRIPPSGLEEGSRSQLESVMMFQFIWFFLSLLPKIFSVIAGKARSLAVGRSAPHTAAGLSCTFSFIKQKIKNARS